jgi:hypothetical protein
MRSVASLPVAMPNQSPSFGQKTQTESSPPPSGGHQVLVRSTSYVSSAGKSWVYLRDDKRRCVGCLRGGKCRIEGRCGVDCLRKLQAKPIREFDEVPLIEDRIGARRFSGTAEKRGIDQELLVTIDAVGDHEDDGIATVMHHRRQRLRRHVKAAVSADHQRPTARAEGCTKRGCNGVPDRRPPRCTGKRRGPSPAGLLPNRCPGRTRMAIHELSRAAPIRSNTCLYVNEPAAGPRHYGRHAGGYGRVRSGRSPLLRLSRGLGGGASRS